MSANNLVNTKADIFSALVQKELLETASLSPFVEDFSAMAIKGAKSVSIPKLSSFTVQDRAFGAASTENTPLTDAADEILLNKNKIILFGYDAADEMQSSIDYQSMSILRAASAHGRQVNTDILTMWDSIAGLNINGAIGADITINNILDMREFLMANFADMTKAVLCIAADQEKAMLKLPEFSRYDYRGNGTAPVVNGTIGFVYGVPVVINQQVGAQQAYMVEKSGSAIAFQRNAKVAEDSALRYGTDGKEVAVDQTYGVGGLQLGESGVGPTESPLIAKLKD